MKCESHTLLHTPFPPDRSELSKPKQLVVTFTGGYIAGVFCALVSHPADTVVSKLNSDKGSTAIQAAKQLGWTGTHRGENQPWIIIAGGLVLRLQDIVYSSLWPNILAAIIEEHYKYSWNSEGSYCRLLLYCSNNIIIEHFFFFMIFLIHISQYSYLTYLKERVFFFPLRIVEGSGY